LDKNNYEKLIVFIFKIIYIKLNSNIQMSHPVLVPGTIFTEEEYARFITGNMEMKELNSIRAEGRPVPSPPSDFQFQLKPYPPLNGPPKVPTGRFLTGTADEQAKEEAIDAEINKQFNAVEPLTKEYKRTKDAFNSLLERWNHPQNDEKNLLEKLGKHSKKYDIPQMLELPVGNYEKLVNIPTQIRETEKWMAGCGCNANFPRLFLVLEAKIEVLNALFKIVHTQCYINSLSRTF
jgi:hypothetical protein